MIRLDRNNHKFLSMFITAGYPTVDTTVALVTAMAEAGADLVELGIPFSDPIADGPTIQYSSEIALQNGVTVGTTLAISKEIRRQSGIPLILMGYANPVYAYGMERFLSDCKDAGVDGTIIADLPVEESEEYRTVAARNNIATVFLATPTTPPKRLFQLDAASTGFLYFVAVTGVTGSEQTRSAEMETLLKQARTHIRKNPMLVGFGIATSEDAKRAAGLSDGVIVGSALIRTIQTSQNGDVVDSARTFTRVMRKALDELQ